jgi:peroxiredoxin Q/BCP
MGILPGRVTYVIDLDGKVRNIFNSQFNPKAHASAALKAIQAL